MGFNRNVIIRALQYKSYLNYILKLIYYTEETRNISIKISAKIFRKINQASSENNINAINKRCA
jgi:ribosomal protein L28